MECWAARFSWSDIRTGRRRDRRRFGRRQKFATAWKLGRRQFQDSATPQRAGLPAPGDRRVLLPVPWHGCSRFVLDLKPLAPSRPRLVVSNPPAFIGGPKFRGQTRPEGILR